MEENLLKIKVKVADRIYPIRINRDEEGDIREAVKLLDTKILDYKEKYPLGDESKLSSTDYIAMAAVQIATSYVRLTKVKDIDAYAEEIGIINSELEDYLKSE